MVAYIVKAVNTKAYLGVDHGAPTFAFGASVDADLTILHSDAYIHVVQMATQSKSIRLYYPVNLAELVRSASCSCCTVPVPYSCATVFPSISAILMQKCRH